MKTIKYYIAIYVLGAFLTNSYCKVHRWNDWVNENQGSVNKGLTPQEQVELKTFFASVFWPAYVLSRLSTAIVSCKIEC